MTIPASEARTLYNKALVGMLVDRPKPTSFLRSFFTVEETGARNVSIEVQRGSEKVAVDVYRGSEGNYNKVSKSTEKLIEPPYYREWFNATELDCYDAMMGDGDIDLDIFNKFMFSLAQKSQLCMNKIDRAYEIQAVQIFETGTVTLQSIASINYGRKAASLVANGAGNTWATGTVNPYDNLEVGCNFLRAEGKIQGSIVNIVFGSKAWSDFCSNDIVMARADIRNFSLDNIYAPQKNSVGGVLHGEVTIGSYRGRLWTYPEVYEDANGDKQPYLNEKKVFMVPEVTDYVQAFAAVPRVLNAGAAPQLQKGRYHFGEKIDDYDAIHKRDVKSAGVLIPKAVDTIWTLQPVA